MLYPEAVRVKAPAGPRNGPCPDKHSLKARSFHHCACSATKLPLTPVPIPKNAIGTDPVDACSGCGMP